MQLVSKEPSLVIVEDSPTQAARLKHVLTKQNYQVRLADRAQAALTLCREEAPQLLISDIAMPEMDGFELCRAIKGDATLKEIPVMLLTGLSDPEDIVWGLEAGADCYLTKPYSDEDLIDRIEFVLSNVQAEEELDESETTPLMVNFLGRTHVIRSSRKQVLNLLLSTYESAARRNKQLNKEQLKLKIDARDAVRRAEEAESKLPLDRGAAGNGSPESRPAGPFGPNGLASGISQRAASKR